MTDLEAQALPAATGVTRINTDLSLFWDRISLETILPFHSRTLMSLVISSAVWLLNNRDDSLQVPRDDWFTRCLLLRRSWNDTGAISYKLWVRLQVIWLRDARLDPCHSAGYVADFQTNRAVCSHMPRHGSIFAAKECTIHNNALTRNKVSNRAAAITLWALSQFPWLFLRTNDGFRLIDFRNIKKCNRITANEFAVKNTNLLLLINSNFDIPCKSGTSSPFGNVKSCIRANIPNAIHAHVYINLLVIPWYDDTNFVWFEAKSNAWNINGAKWIKIALVITVCHCSSHMSMCSTSNFGLHNIKNKYNTGITFAPIKLSEWKYGIARLCSGSWK